MLNIYMYIYIYIWCSIFPGVYRNTWIPCSSPSVEKVDAFHNLLLMNSGIVLPQELFFQKKCVFQESVYWLNRQQSTQQPSKLIANFQSFIYYYEFLYFLFLFQYLLGWLVLLYTFLKWIESKKRSESLNFLFVKDRDFMSLSAAH